jgi:hypothetical protein
MGDDTPSLMLSIEGLSIKRNQLNLLIIVIDVVVNDEEAPVCIEGRCDRLCAGHEIPSVDEEGQYDTTGQNVIQFLFVKH